VLDDLGHDVSPASRERARPRRHAAGSSATTRRAGIRRASISTRCLTLFSGLRGRRLHEVAAGDTPTAIAREHGQNTRVDDVFAANRDVLTDPDRIRPGQVLRVPLLA
jgi:nucleoid-associated protein YgaU